MTGKTLWIGGYGPEKSAHGAGLRAIREGIELGTNGEIQVDVTWNLMDEGRPNTDLFKLVESGEMFLCYFSSSYLGGRVGELNILETPFLFDDLRAAHSALDGDLGVALREAVRAKTGFEALGFWDNGFRHMTNRLRPIRSPQDMRGMKVRMQPNAIHEELIRSWGAVPVAVELSEAVRMIADLEVDAQENPLANTVAYGVDKVHPYVTMTGHLYGARGLFAHRSTYDAFPDDVQKAVDDSVARAVDIQRFEARNLETKLRTDLESSGLEFIDLSPGDRAAFVEAAAPAMEMAHEAIPHFLLDLAGK